MMFLQNKETTMFKNRSITFNITLLILVQPFRIIIKARTTATGLMKRATTPPPLYYRSDTVNLKSFVGKFWLQIKSNLN